MPCLCIMSSNCLRRSGVMVFMCSCIRSDALGIFLPFSSRSIWICHKPAFIGAGFCAGARKVETTTVQTIKKELNPTRGIEVSFTDFRLLALASGCRVARCTSEQYTRCLGMLTYVAEMVRCYLRDLGNARAIQYSHPLISVTSGRR